MLARNVTGVGSAGHDAVPAHFGQVPGRDRGGHPLPKGPSSGGPREGLEGGNSVKSEGNGLIAGGPFCGTSRTFVQI